VRFFPILCVSLIAACFLPSSQYGATGPVSNPNSPFDSYGNLCWQDEQARLDNFAIQLQNDRTLTGEIIVYAGRISCRDEAKYRGNRARNHLIKRGVYSKRVIVKDGGFQPDISTVLSLRPNGAPPYDVRPSLTKDEVSIKRCIDKVFEKVLCLEGR
jgi:hypothetical protein